jgi:hypothetical protein
MICNVVALILYAACYFMQKDKWNDSAPTVGSAILLSALGFSTCNMVVDFRNISNKVRGVATSIAVLSLWVAYFVLVFTFPILFDRLGDKTFYIYSAICLIGFAFVYFKVKETKGKTLEELEMVFH